MGSTQEHQPRFETLQLHAGYVDVHDAAGSRIVLSRGVTVKNQILRPSHGLYRFMRRRWAFLL